MFQLQIVRFSLACIDLKELFWGFRRVSYKREVRLLLKTFFFKPTRRENDPHLKSKSLHISLRVGKSVPLQELLNWLWNLARLVQITQLVKHGIARSMNITKVCFLFSGHFPESGQPGHKAVWLLSGRLNEMVVHRSTVGKKTQSFCTDGRVMTLFLLWTLNEVGNVKAPSRVPEMLHEWYFSLTIRLYILNLPWKGRCRVSRFGNLRRKLEGLWFKAKASGLPSVEPRRS